MYVLMFNRGTIYESPGGDTIQMNKTRGALQRLGIHADIATPDSFPLRPQYDIVHLFNIQTAEDTLVGLRWASKHHIPVVLSPIFWDMRDSHYEQARRTGTQWRIITNLFGRRLVRALYKQWQGMKAPLNQTWRLQRTILHQSIRVLPNAQAEANMIQNYFRLNRSWRDKVRIIPNAVDKTMFEAIPATSSIVQQHDVARCVLQVGWIGKSKNQLGLINALFDVPVKIVFVGQPSPYEPDYVTKCYKRAERRGNTLFLGRLPHEGLPAIYAAAAVHVLPSWRETPGLANLEAAAAGCRVVSTCIGSAYEYFGDMAWYCDPRDLSSIKHAVLAALDSPVPKGLREKVLSEYTWERVARLTLQAYQEVVSNGGNT